MKGEKSFYSLSTTVKSIEMAGPVKGETGQAPAMIAAWQALVFAFIGGLILNLMPCVFPILSLKAFALIQAGSLSRRERIKDGWAYTLGILASFAVIIIVLLALRSAGAVIGWGFQLQEPKFIAFMVFLFTLVALSLAGLFHFRTGFEGAGQQLTEKKGAKGAFFTGVLATLVATPCTVPFMAPAVGFALSQSPVMLTLVLLFLGLGLATPFLLLSYSDSLARKLPKPGPWMEAVKQGLAFPMLLAALWLASVYEAQTGSFFLLLSFVLLLAFLLWLREKISQDFGKKLLLGLTLLAFVFFMVQPSGNRIISNDNNSLSGFSVEKVEALRKEGKAVFVYFTADWCITCKVNESVALDRTETKQLFKDYKVTVLKSDETAGFKPETLAILKKYGRAGIPLYLYYPADGRPAKLLPAVITVDIIKDYVTGNGG